MDGFFSFLSFLQPCFDTKLLKKSKKEDKQFLLEDIEDVGGSYRKLPNCGDGTAERK